VVEAVQFASGFGESCQGSVSGERVGSVRSGCEARNTGRCHWRTTWQQPNAHRELECGLPTNDTAADSKLAEAAHWRVLASQLDDPFERDTASVILTCVRRLEALLEDEFDACGSDLAEKARSVRARISSELLLELLAVSALQEQAACPPPLAEVHASCDRTVTDLLRDAVAAQPRTADGSMARGEWTLRHPTVAGVVRKIRKWEDGLRHAAVMDLDGHLIDLRISKIIQIEPGDRVVLMRRGKHEATEYYNVTKKIGLEPLSAAGTHKLLMAGAGVFIVGIAGTVVTVLLAIRGVHRWGDLPSLWKFAVTGVPAVLVACIGVGMLGVGSLFRGAMGEFRRAIEKETGLLR
jgi:hypothetical protein